MNNASRQAAEGGDNPPRPAESEIKKISVFDLVPSEDNFYSMREIEELKAAIEIAGKVLQNLTVVPLDGGKYKVMRATAAASRRWPLWKMESRNMNSSPVPWSRTRKRRKIREIRDGLNLIVTNSQREKTAWDKIEEVRYLRDVLEKAKDPPAVRGRPAKIVKTVFGDSEVQADGTRDFIAKVLHTSPAQIGRYDTIIRHLSPEFKEELKADRINLSTAYELAGLPEEGPAGRVREYQRAGEISIKAARGEAADGPSPPRRRPNSRRRNLEETAPPAEPVGAGRHTPPAAVAFLRRPASENRMGQSAGAEHPQTARRTRRTGRSRRRWRWTEGAEKPTEDAQGRTGAERQPQKETRCVGERDLPVLR